MSPREKIPFDRRGNCRCRGERSVDETKLIVAEGLYNALLGAGFPPATATFLDFNLDFLNRQTTTNYAVFGNATFDVTDALTVELGGRYTSEKKRFFQRAMRRESGAPLLFNTPQYELSDSWNNFSPRASAPTSRFRRARGKTIFFL